jgi:NTE family protein
MTNNYTSDRPRLGIALGGGAIRGYSHLGVLAALQEEDLAPTAISGTSVGAVVAALYAFGVPMTELRARIPELKWREISAPTLAPGGLFSNRELGTLIQEAVGEARIEDASIPLAIVATDVASGEKVVFREGDVARAVMASACIPGVYVPVQYGERMLIDGALVEDVPISPLPKMGAELVVGVHLCPLPYYRPPASTFEVLVNATYIAIATSAKLQLQAADVVITPDLSRFSRVSTRQCPDLFEVGYAAGRAAVPEIRAAMQRMSAAALRP